MGGLTGYLFPQPIRDSVFSTERGLEYLSKGHNSTRDKKRRSMVVESTQGLSTLNLNNFTGLSYLRSPLPLLERTGNRPLVRIRYLSLMAHVRLRSGIGIVVDLCGCTIIVAAKDPPLLPDVLRERELASRLNLSFIGRHSWADMRQFVSMVTKQTLIEKRVEAALVQDGFRPENILSQPPRARSATHERSEKKARGILRFWAMAIHLSLRVAPLDLQQGGNSRIPYVHVPAARMSILVYIATAINTFLFLLTKHPLFLRSSGTGTEMGAFSTLFTLVTGGFRGRPMWGTFWVWDARLTSVFISFLIYLGALCFQKLPVEPAPISIRAGPIDIPIIKSSVNWWNTSHQPGSISRSGTSIHVPMPIPILSNFANSPLSTPILFVLETRLPIPSFLESPLKEEIEAREGIPKPSSLAESLCIHG
ncbi:UNVERIFIED_CONTAM: putative cytochrome c biosynthesis ccmC-like mitochondrial protein [Sesamum indicum]